MKDDVTRFVSLRHHIATRTALRNRAEASVTCGETLQMAFPVN